MKKDKDEVFNLLVAQAEAEGIERALEEARLVTKAEEPYEVSFDGVEGCIRDLLDIIDQKDGDIEAIEDEFNGYKDFIEDNYRHKTPSEMGWE